MAFGGFGRGLNPHTATYQPVPFLTPVLVPFFRLKRVPSVQTRRYIPSRGEHSNAGERLNGIQGQRFDPAYLHQKDRKITRFCGLYLQYNRCFVLPHLIALGQYLFAKDTGLFCFSQNPEQVQSPDFCEILYPVSPLKRGIFIPQQIQNQNKH